MGPTELDRLKDTFASAVAAAGWYGKVLLAGLIAELFIEFIFREKKSRTEIAANLICAFVVAIGVWGENHFGERAREAASALTENESFFVNWRIETERKRFAEPVISKEVFVKALSGKPKGTVEILYQPEDLIAYSFASHIHELLLAADWKVSEPKPAKPSDDSALSKVPSIVAAGGHRFGGLSLVANAIGGPVFDTATPYGALADALLRAGSDESGDRSPLKLNTRPPDPMLRDNELRIVIGPGPYIM